MQQDQPPPDYFEIVNDVQTASLDDRNTAAAASSGVAGIHDVETQRPDNHDQVPATVETVRQLHNLIQDTVKYLKHPRGFEGAQNATNSYRGLLDVLYKQKKLPFGFTKIIIYKLTLLIYFLTNFIYSIAAVSVQGEHVAHYIIYVLISLTGLLFETIVIAVDVHGATRQGMPVQTDTQPREAWAANAGIRRDYPRKAKSVLIDYVLLSLGEFLIYPILICTMYGFINERAWRFDNGISGFNFLFFLYSVIMDLVFMKIYMIWAVIRIIQATHRQYRIPWEWKRCFTPVYLTIPFAILTALTQWFMIGIIGVRIYVDNFNPENYGSIPNTGDYMVAPFTGYMIGFTLCLPLLSSIVYILLNKHWFYEIYTVIHQSTTGRAESRTSQLSWNMKLLAFARDPLACLSIINLMVLFMVFTVGVYLPDYGYEVATSARDAVEGLGTCFIILFLLSNVQAAIIFTIMLLTIVTMSLCVLCIVSACLYSHKSE